MNVHVCAKPPFYLVFVLFWFCSDTCQNETLRQQLQGGSAALFPFGFGIAFAPRGTKEARWASPFPSAFPGGGCGPQPAPPRPGLPIGLSPPRGPGSRSEREAASSQHTQIRSLGLGAGKASFFGENREFHARRFMYYIYNINISKSVFGVFLKLKKAMSKVFCGPGHICK